MDMLDLFGVVNMINLMSEKYHVQMRNKSGISKHPCIFHINCSLF